MIGLEAEFRVFIDDLEVKPEAIWRTPSGFIDEPLFKRTGKSSQLPTGGAVYFDGGVIEVVTPVIEIAPQCTSRVVRSLWEQIEYVRRHLDRWEEKTGRRVRLEAFSCHYNISFEVEAEQRHRNRNIQKLANLLIRLLAVPVIVIAANRRSTGIGVRPRGDRLEVTLDFTPDPGLMAATAALIVGIVREVITWDSYLVSEIEARSIRLIDDLEPGRHATRKGWLFRDEHFPANPFATSLDARVWPTATGLDSLRKISFDIAIYFRDSIRRHSDPFSIRVLFGVLQGEIPALLDLSDRPAAYDDVGRTIRWGETLPELRDFVPLIDTGLPSRRRADRESGLQPPWRGQRADRRKRAMLPPRVERRTAPSRRQGVESPPPRLTRSAYEKVFRALGRKRSLRIGGKDLTPVAVKGWYHSVLRASDGEERLLSIDQILRQMRRKSTR